MSQAPKMLRSSLFVRCMLSLLFDIAVVAKTNSATAKPRRLQSAGLHNVTVANLATVSISTWNPEGREIRFGTPLTLGPETFLSLVTSGRVDDEDLEQWYEARSLARAYELCFNWVNNERGGIQINGQMYKASLTMIDDMNDGDVARVGFNYLYDEGIRLFLGPASGGQKPDKFAEAANSKDDALVLMPLGAAESTYAGRPRIFGISSAQFLGPRALIEYFKDKDEVNKVLYFHDNSTDSAGCISNITDFVREANMTLVGNKSLGLDNRTHAAANGQFYDDDATFSQKVAEIRDLQPDIILGCDQSVGVRFLKEAIDQQYAPKIYWDQNLLTKSEYLEALEDHAPGKLAGRFVFGSLEWQSTLNLSSGVFPQWSAARLTQELESLYPGFAVDRTAAVAFAACEMYVHAIEATNSMEPEVLDQYLKSEFTQRSLDTVFGPVKFDQNGQNSEAFKNVQLQNSGETPKVVIPDLHYTPVWPMPKWSDRDCYQPQSNSTMYGFDLGGPGAGPCRRCEDYEMAEYSQTTQYRTCRNCSAGEVLLHGDNNRTCFVNCSANSSTVGYYPLKDGTCVPCPAGSRVFDDGRYGCSYCPAGTFSVSGDQTCTECPPGRYTSHDGAGAGECVQCPRGRSSYVSGATYCRDCVIGKFASNLGQSECQRCALGQVSTVGGSSACTDCTPGKFALRGNHLCEDCEVGTFQPLHGQDKCNDTNRYPGTVAPLPGMDMPHNKHGFWIPRVFGQDWAPEACALNRRACLENQACIKGHVGRQCLACAPGWAAKEPSGDCFECFSKAYYCIVVIFVIFFVVAIALLMAHMVVSAAERPQDMHLIIFKQLFNHLITMSICSSMFSQVYVDLSRRARNGDLNFVLDEATLQLGSRLVQSLYVWDGSLPADAGPWYSFTCMTMPFPALFGDSNLLEQIMQARHSEWHQGNMTTARQSLIAYQETNERARMVFIFILPTILIIVAYSIGFVKLTRKLRKRKEDYTDALEFYRDIYASGLRVAKRKYVYSVWTKYVNHYYTKIWDIWWPMQHASRYISSNRIDFQQFFDESYVIGFAVIFMAYGPVVRGVMRPLRCIHMQLGPNEKQVMLRQSAVECNTDHLVLFWGAWVLSIFWCFVVPLWAWYQLRRGFQKTAGRGRDELTRKWGLMVIGYRPTCWWWETVIFFRKSVNLVIEAAPLPTDVSILVFMISSIFFSAIHFVVDPYDKRGNGLLESLERYQLLVWICAVLGIRLCHTAEGETTLILVPTVIVTINAIYVAAVIYHLGMQLLSNVSARLDKSALNAEEPKGYIEELWKEIRLKMVEFYQYRSQGSPYIAMDDLYGWLTVCGNRGDLAFPPMLSKRAKDDLDHGPKGADARIRISTAPKVPEGVQIEVDGEDKSREQTKTLVVKRADHQCQVELLKMLSIAIQHCATVVGPAFSMSILEFVIRAAFVLQRSSNRRADGNNDIAQEVTRDNKYAANATGDPLRLMGVGGSALGAHGEAREDVSDTEEEHAKYWGLAQRIEEELRTSSASILRGGRRTEEKPDEHAKSALVEGAATVTGLATGIAEKTFEGAFKVTGTAASALNKGAEAVVGKSIVAGATKATQGFLGVGKSAMRDVVATTKFAAGAAEALTQATVHAAVAAEKSALEAVHHNASHSHSYGTSSKSAANWRQGDDDDDDEEEDGSENSGEDNAAAKVAVAPPALDEESEEEEPELMEDPAKDEQVFRDKYRNIIKQMFSKDIFRKGLHISGMEFALLQLQNRPDRELRIWLDMFEERWIHERVEASQELVRMYGGSQIIEVQCDRDEEDRKEVNDSKATWEKEKPRVETADKDVQTEKVEDRSVALRRLPSAPRDDINHATYEALQWLRLVLQLHGGLSVFKASDLRVTLQRRQGKSQEETREQQMLKQIGDERRRRKDAARRNAQAQADLHRLQELEEADDIARFDAQQEQQQTEPQATVSFTRSGAGRPQQSKPRSCATMGRMCT